METVRNYMISIGSILALFFSILLLTKKRKNRADNILFAWLLLISAHIFLFNINYLNLYSEYPHLIGIDLAFPILQSLALYFYVRSLTTGQLFRLTDLLHLFPSIAAYIYLIPFFAHDGVFKYQYFQNVRITERYYLGILLIATILSGIIYTLLSVKLTQKYRIFIGQQFSYTEKINLYWLKRIIFGMSVIWVVVLIVKFWQFSSASAVVKSYDYFIFLAVSCFVIYLGYYGIKQTNIFSDHQKTDFINEYIPKFTKNRYQKSGLKEEQIQIIIENLRQLMVVKKQFQDNQLSLATLAKDLNISPNYLSQVINDRFSKNFYDFVNYYRIAEFKRMVEDKKYQNYSILALAHECGFNSKSAFYSVFKKEVGITPSEYLKKRLSVVA